MTHHNQTKKLTTWFLKDVLEETQKVVEEHMKAIKQRRNVIEEMRSLEEKVTLNDLETAEIDGLVSRFLKGI
jgi:hypothetical protein